MVAHRQDPRLMAVTIISRAGWGAKPAESVTPWNPAELLGICQHWFGSPKAAATHAGCDDLLRSVQRSHQAGEFNDIAYNFGVCPHGSVYELRGWNRQTGANGTNDANKTLLAIVYMAGVGDPLTNAGKESLIALYAEAFRRGVGVKAVGHGSVAPTGTDCPGAQLRNFLSSGVWRPAPPVQKVRWRVTDAEGKNLTTEMAAIVPGPDEYEAVKRWLITKNKAIVDGARRDGDVALKRRKV
jgi:hypothetical protein